MARWCDCSTHILRTLRRPHNGVWLVDHGLHAAYAEPVGIKLCDDLQLLLASPQLVGGEGSQRHYVFEQAVQFFIQFVLTLCKTKMLISKVQIVKSDSK